MQTRFRDQIHATILDAAAGLIARQGLDKTSLQDIASAVGLSKAGLQHHFPTKEALHEGILQQARELVITLFEHVRALPAGPARDAAVIEAIVDGALAHPGLVAMMLLRRGTSDRPASELGESVQELFDPDPAPVGQDRLIRIKVAMGSVAVLTQYTPQPEQTTSWRRMLAAACFDALGHSRPSASAITDHDPEA